MKMGRGGVPPLIALPLAGCSTMPAALDPKGPEAGAVSWLIWSFTGLCAVIWLLVTLFLIASILRRQRPRTEPLALNAPAERQTGVVIGTLVMLTGLIVVGLTVLSYAAQQQLFAPRDALTIQVIGHQWWWELRYPDPDPSRTIVTANEVHVPVGKTVRLQLTSNDVIHSFWVPSLMGKADLIPGRTNELAFTAQKAGAYNGQCAEFCGLEHTYMGLKVVADEPADFENWKASQVAAAAQPATDTQQQGLSVFLLNPCMSCHSIRGTPAGGTLGPDLTHLASRQTIAAGRAPLTRGHLAAWITDPQAMKPGVNMPTVPIPSEQLDPLLDYLMALR
ncbi:MAG: cytochrome c oxidase subunit II [Devosia sp.]